MKLKVLTEIQAYYCNMLKNFNIEGAEVFTAPTYTGIANVPRNCVAAIFFLCEEDMNLFKLMNGVNLDRLYLSFDKDTQQYRDLTILHDVNW